MTPKQKDDALAILILGMRSLVARQEMEVQVATRENKLDGWMYDHAEVIRDLEKELKELTTLAYKLVGMPTSG